MTDTPQTTELNDFKISIEWHAAGRAETRWVIARSLDDAKEIARRLFLLSRTSEVVIDSVKDVTDA